MFMGAGAIVILPIFYGVFGFIGTLIMASLFNLVVGALAPDAGRVTLAGRDITGLRADRVCAAGIGRTFQLVKPFQDLTVLDNVTVGALHAERSVAGAKRAAARILGLTASRPR